jgi:hypothetical protein
MTEAADAAEEIAEGREDAFLDTPLLRVLLPGTRLVSLANRREHWIEKWRRSKSQRAAAKLLVQAAMSRKPKAERPKLPLLVRITRVYEGNDLDADDNLNISGKHVRDGVSDALGIDDGSPLIAWRYCQMPGPTGVLVEMFSRHCCSCCGEVLWKKFSVPAASSSKRL